MRAFKFREFSDSLLEGSRSAEELQISHCLESLGYCSSSCDVVVRHLVVDPSQLVTKSVNIDSSPSVNSDAGGCVDSKRTSSPVVEQDSGRRNQTTTKNVGLDNGLCCTCYWTEQQDSVWMPALLHSGQCLKLIVKLIQKRSQSSQNEGLSERCDNRASLDAENGGHVTHRVNDSVDSLRLMERDVLRGNLSFPGFPLELLNQKCLERIRVDVGIRSCVDSTLPSAESLCSSSTRRMADRRVEGASFTDSDEASTSTTTRSSVDETSASKRSNNAILRTAQLVSSNKLRHHSAHNKAAESFQKAALLRLQKYYRSKMHLCDREIMQAYADAGFNFPVKDTSSSSSINQRTKSAAQKNNVNGGGHSSLHRLQLTFDVYAEPLVRTEACMDVLEYMKSKVRWQVTTKLEDAQRRERPSMQSDLCATQVGPGRRLGSPEHVEGQKLVERNSEPNFARLWLLQHLSRHGCCELTELQKPNIASRLVDSESASEILLRLYCSCQLLQVSCLLKEVRAKLAFVLERSRVTEFEGSRLVETLLAAYCFGDLLLLSAAYWRLLHIASIASGSWAVEKIATVAGVLRSSFWSSAASGRVLDKLSAERILRMAAETVDFNISFAPILALNTIVRRICLEPLSGYRICRLERFRQENGGFPHVYILSSEHNSHVLLVAVRLSIHYDTYFYRYNSFDTARGPVRALLGRGGVQSRRGSTTEGRRARVGSCLDAFRQSCIECVEGMMFMSDIADSAFGNDHDDFIKTSACNFRVSIPEAEESVIGEAVRYNWEHRKALSDTLASEYPHRNAACVGRLVEGFWGTSFTLFEGCSSESRNASNTENTLTVNDGSVSSSTKPIIVPQCPAVPLLNIRYEANILGDAPRRLDVTLKEDGRKVNIPMLRTAATTHMAHKHVVEEVSLKDLAEYFGRSSHGGTVVLRKRNELPPDGEKYEVMKPSTTETYPTQFENLKPVWNTKIQSFALPFYGRAREASARNFQLVERSGDTSTIYLMHGKISKDVFALDFRCPISDIDALAIAIAAFAKKRAVA
eukprot:Lankesteria_metandrocarpae@DN4460_c0_g1_i1.p1